jgi:hypothetical protein
VVIANAVAVRAVYEYESVAFVSDQRLGVVVDPAVLAGGHTVDFGTVERDACAGRQTGVIGQWSAGSGLYDPAMERQPGGETSVGLNPGIGYDGVKP